MFRLVAEQEGSFLVAESEGSVVGFAIGLIHNSTPDEEFQTVPTRSGRVQELFVTESQRGDGIGAALLTAMEVRFRAQGCDVIHIDVFAPNKDARRFYERHGYAPRQIDQLKVL